MANRSYLDPRDEFENEDDQSPYDSISNRGPLQDVQGIAPQPELPAPDTSSIVNSYISKKMSPPPAVSTPSMASIESDPYMQQYLKDQSSLNDMRMAKVGADFQSNFGQAMSQLAQGTNAPKDNGLYKNIDSQNQALLTDKDKDMDRRARVVNAVEQRQSRQQVAADNRALRQSVLTAGQATKQSALDQKTTDRQNTMFNSTQALLESARGSPAVSQAEKDLYAADKAKSLTNLYGDPNKLSNAQVQLLASEISKIASGGVPSQHELEGLTPQTLSGKLSGITSQFLNKPTAANAGAFIKQYQDYANALGRDAQKVIKERYGRVIESRKPQMSPEQYQSLQDQYIGRFAQSDHSAHDDPDMNKAIAAGHTEDGFRFKGGDPSKPENWEKVN